MTQRSITSEDIKRCEDGLLAIHKVLKYTDKVSMTDLALDNNLSKAFIAALRKGMVIGLTGKAKGARWKWLTVPPTSQMAYKTIKEARVIQRKRFEESRVIQRKRFEDISANKPKEEKNTKANQVFNAPPAPKDSFEISILWGLISYKRAN